MINKMNYAIGIDLGTTYSCAGVWRNGRIEIITNQMGERTVPSIVAFTETKRLIGNEAKNQMTKNYKNTVYDAKRLIGRNFSNEIVQKDMKLWPFTVKEDNKDRPLICVEYKKEKKEFYPEQISAMILEKLKNNAETYLGQEVKDAVIAVPAYFNNLQRQATIDAGRIAGLNVIKTINEPTAAAIAYGLNEDTSKKKNICVFDLGGGTFDVTILEIHNKKFTVKASGGDSHLGGQDFDNELIKYCVEEFKESTDIDISQNQKALRRLKVACEKAKIELSSIEDTLINLDSLAEGNDIELNVTRFQFEKMCNDYFNKCIKTLSETINNAGLSKNDIDDIVLVGGSSRIPKIQQKIKEFFDNKKELSKKINPDEAVAIGAAIEAVLHNEEQKEDLEDIKDLEDIVVIDVVPLSLGIGSRGGVMSFIIKRNTQIPCENTDRFTTIEDNQTNFGICVYEGEREFYKDNLLLDEFSLDNITPAPKGETAMLVTFKINENYSILEVMVVEEGKENNNIPREIKRRYRDEEEIERMIEIGKKMREEDLERRKAIDEKNKLDDLLYDIKKNKNKYEQYKNEIDDKITEVKNWMKEHKDRSFNDYKNKIDEVKDFYDQLI